MEDVKFPLLRLKTLGQIWVFLLKEPICFQEGSVMLQIVWKIYTW